jgi:hypothetical protein
MSEHTKTPGCFPCDNTSTPAKLVTSADDIALCTYHWNWWLVRYLNTEEAPPCAAHLMEGQA